MGGDSFQLALHWTLHSRFHSLIVRKALQCWCWWAILTVTPSHLQIHLAEASSCAGNTVPTWSLRLIRALLRLVDLYCNQIYQLLVKFKVMPSLSSPSRPIWGSWWAIHLQLREPGPLPDWVGHRGWTPESDQTAEGPGLDRRLWLTARLRSGSRWPGPLPSAAPGLWYKFVQYW